MPFYSLEYLLSLVGAQGGYFEKYDILIFVSNILEIPLPPFLFYGSLKKNKHITVFSKIRY